MMTLARTSPLFALAFGTFALTAQTSTPPAARPAVHHAATSAAHRSTVAGCAKLPELSPKIPALPAGTRCAKTLYTITSSASNLSPLLSSPLRDSLEKIDQSFSLTYVDTKIGTGELAKPQQFYTVNYTGYLLDGTMFDSSVGKDPFTFPYGAHRVIQGWDSGFEGMRAGGKRRLFIPYQLAYGERGNQKIPAKSELVFDVEFISQTDKPPTPKTPPAQPGVTTPPTGASGARPGTPAPGQPSVSPAGAGAPPPATSSTPSSSTAPTTPPKPQK